VVCLCTLSAGAQQNLVESVVNGCKAELDTYCKDVTPGEGRILACLYARNDKLSGKCELRSMMPPYSWSERWLPCPRWPMSVPTIWINFAVMYRLGKGDF
jgi:hypothetical protein